MSEVAASTAIIGAMNEPNWRSFGNTGPLYKKYEQELIPSLNKAILQGIGDHVKALDRIQQILTHAPLSKAAEALRERAVLDT